MSLRPDGFLPFSWHVEYDCNASQCDCSAYNIESVRGNSFKNPTPKYILPTKQFPQLTFRIGIDSGEAVVKNIGDSSNKQQKDLIGLTINLATKIQGHAKDNGILIGDTTLRRLHADKRICFRKQEDYSMSENASPYPLHALTKYPDNQSIAFLID